MWRVCIKTWLKTRLIRVLFPEHVEFVEGLVRENEELRRRDQKNTALLTSRAVFFHTWDEAMPDYDAGIIVYRRKGAGHCAGPFQGDMARLLRACRYTHWAYVPPDLLS